MVYKHANLETLLLLHSAAISAVMLSVVKMPLRVEVSGHALNSHGHYVVDHGKSWKNHGILLLNYCGNPGKYKMSLAAHFIDTKRVSKHVSVLGVMEYL